MSAAESYVEAINQQRQEYLDMLLKQLGSHIDNIHLTDDDEDDTIENRPLYLNSWQELSDDEETNAIFIECPGAVKEDADITIDKDFIHVDINYTIGNREYKLKKAYSIDEDYELNPESVVLSNGLLKMLFVRKESAKPVQVEIR